MRQQQRSPGRGDLPLGERLAREVIALDRLRDQRHHGSGPDASLHGKTQAGVLSGEAKASFAAKLTGFHPEYAGVPKNWVHIVFHEYALGNGFTAGEVAATAALTLLIRSGRSPEYKRGLLKHLWELLQEATGAGDDQIVIGIQEVPPSQAMEMGQIMPDVTEQ
jgi:phenylpyruvate tautomerase PptA (4-oxalocrotonate tautomerase family)